jgi:Ni,Fe-hydrogenase maturation factor
MNKPITILGLGNLLLSEMTELGPRIVEEVKRGGLPNGIEAVSVRGVFLSVLGYPGQGVKKLFAVDALQCGGSPGNDLFWLHPNEILRGG